MAVVTAAFHSFLPPIATKKKKKKKEKLLTLDRH